MLSIVYSSFRVLHLCSHVRETNIDHQPLQSSCRVHIRENNLDHQQSQLSCRVRLHPSKNPPILHKQNMILPTSISFCFIGQRGPALRPSSISCSSLNGEGPQVAMTKGFPKPWHSMCRVFSNRWHVFGRYSELHLLSSLVFPSMLYAVEDLPAMKRLGVSLIA